VFREARRRPPNESPPVRPFHRAPRWTIVRRADAWKSEASEKRPKPTPKTAQDDSGRCETNRKSFIPSGPVLS
jgi:hypothetical protein